MGGIDLLSEIGDGRLVKMEIDYSDQVQKTIPEAEKQAKAGKLKEATDTLLSLEKQTRLAADMRSNQKLLIAIVKLCHESNQWDFLNEIIVGLTKKRSIIKQAVSAMVQECCKYVDDLPDEESRLKYIDTLRKVTAGKIYVEVERARLTSKLSKMKEADGDLEEACKILLELQIETYGSIERQEKVELLLEQMRLCIARNDFVRTQIISKKISTKFFDDSSTEVQDLKMKYYRLMIELDEHDENYLNICRHHMAVYKTPKIERSDASRDEVLKNIVLFVLLAPHDNEQSDLLHRIKADRNLEKIPQYKKLLELFTIQELINWQACIVAEYQTVLMTGTPSSPPTGLFDLKIEKGKKRWSDLQTRVVEHNIRMIAKYYTRISMKRMAGLLDLSEAKAEELLCELVVKGTVSGAKIDRPTGIVRFVPRPSATDLLDDWSTNVKSLMDVLNKVTHLILKEEMVHQHLHGGKDKAGPSSASTS